MARRLDPRRQLNGYLNVKRKATEAAFRAGLARVEDSISLAALADLMDRGITKVPLFTSRLEGVWDDWIEDELHSMLLASVESGAFASGRSRILLAERFEHIPAFEPAGPVKILKQFPAEEGVLAFLEEHKAFLRRHFGNQTGDALAEILQVAARNGQWGSGTVARDLRGLLTLTPREAARLARAYEFDRQNGVSARDARARLKSREEVLREARIGRVAQHEVAQMWNRGSLESVKERVRSGEIEPGVRKVWLTTRDDLVCPICRPLHKKSKALEDDFKSKAFVGQSPPGHIGCRCALAYARKAIRRFFPGADFGTEDESFDISALEIITDIGAVAALGGMLFGVAASFAGGASKRPSIPSWISNLPPLLPPPRKVFGELETIPYTVITDSDIAGAVSATLQRQMARQIKDEVSGAHFILPDTKLTRLHKPQWRVMSLLQLKYREFDLARIPELDKLDTFSARQFEIIADVAEELGEDETWVQNVFARITQATQTMGDVDTPFATSGFLHDLDTELGEHMRLPTDVLVHQDGGWRTKAGIVLERDHYNVGLRHSFEPLEDEAGAWYIKLETHEDVLNFKQNPATRTPSNNRTSGWRGSTLEQLDDDGFLPHTWVVPVAPKADARMVKLNDLLGQTAQRKKLAGDRLRAQLRNAGVSDADLMTPGFVGGAGPPKPWPVAAVLLRLQKNMVTKGHAYAEDKIRQEIVQLVLDYRAAETLWNDPGVAARMLGYDGVWELGMRKLTVLNRSAFYAGTAVDPLDDLVFTRGNSHKSVPSISALTRAGASRVAVSRGTQSANTTGFVRLRDTNYFYKTVRDTTFANAPEAEAAFSEIAHIFGLEESVALQRISWLDEKVIVGEYRPSTIISTMKDQDLMARNDIEWLPFQKIRTLEMLAGIGDRHIQQYGLVLDAATGKRRWVVYDFEDAFSSKIGGQRHHGDGIPGIRMDVGRFWQPYGSPELHLPPPPLAFLEEILAREQEVAALVKDYGFDGKWKIEHLQRWVDEGWHQRQQLAPGVPINMNVFLGFIRGDTIKFLSKAPPKSGKQIMDIGDLINALLGGGGGNTPSLVSSSSGIGASVPSLLPGVPRELRDRLAHNNLFFTDLRAKARDAIGNLFEPHDVFLQAEAIERDWKLPLPDDFVDLLARAIEQLEDGDILENTFWAAFDDELALRSIPSGWFFLPKWHDVERIMADAGDGADALERLRKGDSFWRADLDRIVDQLKQAQIPADIADALMELKEARDDIILALKHHPTVDPLSSLKLPRKNPFKFRLRQLGPPPVVVIEQAIGILEAKGVLPVVIADWRNRLVVANAVKRAKIIDEIAEVAAGPRFSPGIASGIAELIEPNTTFATPASDDFRFLFAVGEDGPSDLRLRIAEIIEILDEAGEGNAGVISDFRAKLLDIGGPLDQPFKVTVGPKLRDLLDEVAELGANLDLEGLVRPQTSRAFVARATGSELFEFIPASGGPSDLRARIAQMLTELEDVLLENESHNLRQLIEFRDRLADIGGPLDQRFEITAGPKLRALLDEVANEFEDLAPIEHLVELNPALIEANAIIFAERYGVNAAVMRESLGIPLDVFTDLRARADDKYGTLVNLAWRFEAALEEIPAGEELDLRIRFRNALRRDEEPLVFLPGLVKDAEAIRLEIRAGNRAPLDDPIVFRKVKMMDMAVALHAELQPWIPGFKFNLHGVVDKEDLWQQVLREWFRRDDIPIEGAPILEKLRIFHGFDTDVPEFTPPALPAPLIAPSSPSLSPIFHELQLIRDKIGTLGDDKRLVAIMQEMNALPPGVFMDEVLEALFDKLGDARNKVDLDLWLEEAQALIRALPSTSRAAGAFGDVDPRLAALFPGSGTIADLSPSLATPGAIEDLVAATPSFLPPLPTGLPVAAFRPDKGDVNLAQMLVALMNDFPDRVPKVLGKRIERNLNAQFQEIKALGDTGVRRAWRERSALWLDQIRENLVADREAANLIREVEEFAAAKANLEGAPVPGFQDIIPLHDRLIQENMRQAFDFEEIEAIAALVDDKPLRLANADDITTLNALEGRFQDDVFGLEELIGHMMGLRLWVWREKGATAAGKLEREFAGIWNIFLDTVSTHESIRTALRRPGAAAAFARFIARWAGEGDTT